VAARSLLLALALAALSAGAAMAQAPAASSSAVLPEGPGADTLRARCLGCHGADLTEQQRLSPTGWTREVEKMMRWGAVVSETDKPALVQFLASRYPVR
jgi:mono/diheme cytochrome c family protein